MWCLVNIFGGRFGCWQTYDEADNYRLMLDDWDLWSIENVDFL